MIGIGSSNYDIAIYIANRPDIDDFPALTTLRPLAPGEVQYIGQQTSNHWRKVFNVSAKLLFEVRHNSVSPENGDAPSILSWQQLRDQSLFQQNGKEALLFSPPLLNKDDNIVHIVAGKTYAKTLALNDLTWIDDQFAVSDSARLVVCPYLDYRQLSNIRIEKLVRIIKALRNKSEKAISKRSLFST